MRPRAHEASEDRLPGCHRVAHQLDIKQRLQDSRDANDPQQSETVLYEGCWAEEKFSASKRGTENNDAGSDGIYPR